MQILFLSLLVDDKNRIRNRSKQRIFLLLLSVIQNETYICLVEPLQSCYSPASSVISVSTNRSVNIKESKEKKNREKLLAGPGSEFSLAPLEDMEMDYYDYNVDFAGAAPGSYLGMDPAYLVWIPPIDDGTEHTEDEHSDANCNNNSNSNSNESSDATHSEEEPHYDEISPTYEHIGNRKYDEAPELPPPNKISISPESNNYIEEKSRNSNKVLIANAFSAIDDVDSPKGIRRKMAGNVYARKMPVVDAIPMTEFKSKKSHGNVRHTESPAKVHRTQSYQNQEQRCSYASDDKDMGTEKETAVVKSPSDNFKDYYELDDIQFADDDSDGEFDALNRDQNELTAEKMCAAKNSHALFEMH